MYRKISLLLIFIIVTISEIYSKEITWGELKLIANNIKINNSIFFTKNKWDKKCYTPILDTEIKRNYRTIINENSKLEPNFDGKYRIITFGYGSSAQDFFMLDLNSGIVYEGRTSSFGLKYSINSSLIILNPIENMDWGNDDEIVPSYSSTEYINWNGQEFKTIIVLNELNIYNNK
jgi:hypothetical protein